jgi:hypothetical protein
MTPLEAIMEHSSAPLECTVPSLHEAWVHPQLHQRQRLRRLLLPAATGEDSAHLPGRAGGVSGTRAQSPACLPAAESCLLSLTSQACLAPRLLHMLCIPWDRGARSLVPFTQAANKLEWWTRLRPSSSFPPLPHPLPCLHECPGLTPWWEQCWVRWRSPPLPTPPS